MLTYKTIIRGKNMSLNTENKNESKNRGLSTGATVLISVLAVPVTLLSSLLISRKGRK